MEPLITRICREVTRRQVFAWGVIFTAGIVFLLFNSRYIQNFVAGPYTLEPKDLASIDDIEKTPRYFISVSGEKVIDTGLQEITTTTRNGVKEGSYVSAGYYAVIVGDRFLIVKSPKQPSTTIEGSLTSLPSDLSGQLFTGNDGSELQKHSYPFYMDTEGFRDPGYWAIGITVLFIGLFLVYGRRAWIRLRDIDKHPVVRRVLAWGDPISISIDVENQLASATRFNAHGVSITDKYLVSKKFFVFNLLRFEDLLWAYKKVIKKSVNFIPTGKEYQAILVCYGGSQVFQSSEAVVNQVLAFASARAPWAVLGFTKEIQQVFSKQTNAFCQTVEARRQELLGKT